MNSRSIRFTPSLEERRLIEEFDSRHSVNDILDSANLAAMTNAQANLAGQEYAELRHRTTMRAVAKAYDDALNDPKTIIPTALHAMLEAVRREVNNYLPEVVPPVHGEKS